MSKKSDERIVFDEEKEARFARFLRENEYLIAHIDCLLLHKFLKLMCMGRDKSGPYVPGPREDINCVRENPSAHLYESDIARRWWALSGDVCLPLSDGTTCQLRFAGRPGGSMGPDVRDAVLLFAQSGKPAAKRAADRHGQEKQVAGDVEFHIRSSDWFAHAHHSDARYNNVILHVVLIYDEITHVQRQDGIAIPTCCLNDLPPAAYDPPLWPCRQVIPHMSDEERTRLLNFAGLLRFEQKTQAMLALLRDAQPHGDFGAYDTCLIASLAEGLGYGRDRAFFRAAGLHLLDMMSRGNIPEPLGHTGEPSPLDASRLRVLGKLVQKWRAYGLWETLRNVLLPTSEETSRGGSGGGRGGRVLAPPSGGVGQASEVSDRSHTTSPSDSCGGCGQGVLAPPSGGVGLDGWECSVCPTPPQGGASTLPPRIPTKDVSKDNSDRTQEGGASTLPPRIPTPAPTKSLLIQTIRAVFEGLSTARADILICNVVLPLAAAVALLENDTHLAEQAESLYVRYPALSSNTVTRAMYRQLQLSREPQSACQQQGLHYIYAATCREKQCARCIAGKYEWGIYDAAGR